MHIEYRDQTMRSYSRPSDLPATSVSVGYRRVGIITPLEAQSGSSLLPGVIKSYLKEDLALNVIKYSVHDKLYYEEC